MIRRTALRLLPPWIALGSAVTACLAVGCGSSSSGKEISGAGGSGGNGSGGSAGSGNAAGSNGQGGSGASAGSSGSGGSNGDAGATADASSGGGAGTGGTAGTGGANGSGSGGLSTDSGSGTGGSAGSSGTGGAGTGGTGGVGTGGTGGVSTGGTGGASTGGTGGVTTGGTGGASTGGTSGTGGGTPDAGGGGCLIGGIAYAAGDPNPLDGCTSCQPASSVSSWTNALEGTDCGAGKVCHTGTCQGGCYVSGAFWAPGKYGCQSCIPATSTSSLVSDPEGTSCAAFSVCHNSGCVRGCGIGSLYYAEKALNPSEPCLQCLPVTTTTNWTALADGTSCAAGKVCTAATCTAGCYVLGKFEPPNTVSGDDCQSCQPATSTTAWSNLTDGTACGASTCGGGACVATTWSHTYFDYAAAASRAISIRQVSDGGYLLLIDQSYSVSPYYALGAVLVKLDASGAILWGRRFPPPNVGTPSAGSSIGVGVREAGGAYYVAFREGILARLDTSGALQWAKSYPALQFLTLDVTAAGQLLVAANQPPSGISATYVVVDTAGAVQRAGYIAGTVGAGAIADQSGNIVLYGNQQDPNGAVPWAGKVDPTGPTLSSQLRFAYPGFYASEGSIVGAAETAPGAYAFAGVQTLFYPASSIVGVDHPFVWASGANLAVSTWSTELSSTFEEDAISAMAGGGVAIVGSQISGGLATNGYLLELGSAGALVQASAYSTTGGPSFTSISGTATPGFAISGSLGGPLAMSTKTDGTCAGTCYSGFASSLSVTPSAFGLLTQPGVLTVTAMAVSATTATLSVVATDGFTLTSQCHL